MVKDLLSAINENNVNLKNNEPVVDAFTNNAYLDSFLQKINEIRIRHGKMENTCIRVKQIQNDILSASSESEAANQELDEKTNEIKQDSSFISRQLKALESEIKGSTEESSSEKIKRVQLSVMAQTFKDTIQKHNESQLDFQTKCKDLIRRQCDILEKPISEEDLDKMIENRNVKVFTSNIMKDTEEAKTTLAKIEARHEEIIRLEKSINELSEMITDMSVLISNQGEQINDISHNVAMSKGYVSKAKIEVKKAVEYKKKATKKKWIIGGVIALIILIIILSIAIPLATRTT